MNNMPSWSRNRSQWIFCLHEYIRNYCLSSYRLLVFLSLLLSGCGNAAELIPGPVQAPGAHPTFTALAVPHFTQQFPVPTVATHAPLPVQTPTTVVHPSVNPANPDRALRFIFVQHARCAWSSFWCPVEQGIKEAASDLGVSVTILGPEQMDLKKTASQIDEAVAAKPDGIALTVSDPIFLREAILRATASGIPIIAYNAGKSPIQDELPYLTYLGMDNYQAGYLGGLRLLAAGAKEGVCVNHAPEVSSLKIRCQGFQDAFTENGHKAGYLDTSFNNEQSQRKIEEYLRVNPEVNAILTSAQASSSSYYAFLKTAGQNHKQYFHGTFDLGEEISPNIENGTTLFGIDQQPYLQGYEAVFWLTMINRYGLKPAQPVIPTGPRFVDKNSTSLKSDPKKDIQLYLIHHGLCEKDPYWCVIDQGAQDAAKNMNVQLKILGPDTFDLPKVASQINLALDASPSGLIVAIPDARILRVPILRATLSGLPVIAIDSGFGPVKDNLPYLTYVGQDEYQAGYLAALRLINAGAREAVCVIHQKGQAANEARCQGLLDAFKHRNSKAGILDCGEDPETALNRLIEYAGEHPALNTYVTLSANDPGAVTFYKFLGSAHGKPGKLFHATFDLSPQVAAAIDDGRTLFSIDAQPYLQGYSTVMYMTLLLRKNIYPVLPITPSGPAFIDKSNLAQVSLLAGKYR